MRTEPAEPVPAMARYRGKYAMVISTHIIACEPASNEVGSFFGAIVAPETPFPASTEKNF